MRVNHLTVSNFGSYGHADVDLRGISAAVVVGSNGAGKSTLAVDSVLWALFGQCRTDTDQMMKLGETSMSVSVEFGLNGQDYRVTRTRSKATKAGKSELSLSVKHGDDWVSSSGSKLADTQQKICELLNADYDLCISTGFLLQGQADQFSRATASARKAILAQILRLDQYAILKQFAGRKANDCQARMVEKDERLKTLKASLGDVGQLEAQLVDVQTRQTATEADVKSLDVTLDTTKSTIATLEAKRQSLTAVQDQQTILSGKLNGYQARQRQATEQKTRLEKILANRQAIEAKVVELSGLEKEETTLNQATDIATEDAQIIGKRIQVMQEAIHTAKTKKLSLQIQIDATSHTLAQKVLAYQQDTARMEESYKRDVQSSELLGKVPCTTDLQGKCQFTINAVQAQTRMVSSEVTLANRERLLADIEQAVGADLVQKMAALRSELESVQGHHDGGQLDELKAQQADLGAKLKGLQDDRQRVFAAIQEAKRFTVLIPELLAAEQVLVKTNEELSMLAGEIASVESELQSIRLQLLESVTLESELKTVNDSVSALQRNRQALHVSLQAIGEEIGRIKAKIDQVLGAEEEMTTLAAEVDTLHRDMRLCATLTDAYTKIPVLIMENAIPMLEQESNAVLSRISSTGLRVTFETQKTLKSRDGLAETLDIQVRDAFGERLLENFSGGERARVDLAIRIGLSKMLARRAGAKLETLVVDEAFAAIDRDGMDQLIECLPVLSQEFPLCLFVTHDEGFKHALPQQLVCSKSSNGSVVEVVA